MAAEIEARLSAEESARDQAAERRRLELQAQTAKEAEVKEKSGDMKRDAEAKVKAWMAAAGSASNLGFGRRLEAPARPLPDLLSDLQAALSFAPKIELAPDAPAAEVKKAYMKAARALHPDKVSENSTQQVDREVTLVVGKSKRKE